MCISNNSMIIFSDRLKIWHNTYWMVAKDSPPEEPLHSKKYFRFCIFFIWEKQATASMVLLLVHHVEFRNQKSVNRRIQICVNTEKRLQKKLGIIQSTYQFTIVSSNDVQVNFILYLCTRVSQAWNSFYDARSENFVGDTTIVCQSPKSNILECAEISLI